MGAGVATSPHSSQARPRRRVARLTPPGRSVSYRGRRPGRIPDRIIREASFASSSALALPLPRRVAPKGRGPCRVGSEIPLRIRFR